LLALALTTPYARTEGMGAAMQRHLPRRAAWAVLMLTWALVLLPLSALSWAAVVALSVPAVLVFLRWRRSLRQRLGGYTGDGAGALVELTETGMLLALGLLLPVTA
jgi:adenosylcobinamide-GDP ribazoletransferase